MPSAFVSYSFSCIYKRKKKYLHTSVMYQTTTSTRKYPQNTTNIYLLVYKVYSTRYETNESTNQY